MLDLCPGCSNEVADTAEVCPGCGFKFVVDSGPQNIHGDADNEPRLDGPASLEDNEPQLDGPASEGFSNDDLLAIQTSGLPASMEGDSYEAPKIAPPPPKSQSAGFVIAGLCIAAMAVSSYYFKHQKQAEAARVAAEESKAAADAAKEKMAAEKAAAERTAALVKAAEAERIATAAAEAEVEEPKKKKRRRRKKGRRSNELTAPAGGSGFPEETAVVASAQPVSSDYDSLNIPSTDSGTPDYGSDFRVKGAVYDLYTMEPVGEADIVFSDLKSGKQLSTVTDDSGSFGAHLPINGKGYSLRIRHSKYEVKYLEDGNPSLRNMPEDKRRTEGSELLRTMARVTSFNALRKRVIKRDFMLVPRQ